VEFGVNNNKVSRGLTLNSAGSGQIGAHARRKSIVLGKSTTQPVLLVICVDDKRNRHNLENDNNKGW